MSLNPEYLEFLASRGLSDSDQSRGAFLRFLEGQPCFSLFESEERIPTTNEDFESLNRHAQWAQEQEWIRYRPWMVSVFKMQFGLPNPSPADIEANMDGLWLRLLGIAGGLN